MSGALAWSRLDGCLDCGKCTGSCPVATHGGALSPRRIVREGRHESDAAGAARACLTCRLCDRRCPAKIPFTEAVRELRAREGGAAQAERTSHCGIFSMLSRIQAAEGLSPQRLAWIGDDLRTDPESDMLLWVGCLPHFAAYFDEWSEPILETARSALRVLNRLGIEPAVSNEERCCGHDALWSGDTKTFDALGERNRAWLAASPAKRIVFLCPACASVFREELPARGAGVAQELVTISEFLAEHAPELEGPEHSVVATYHDPCRSGRHLGLYDQPRRALAAWPKVELREMGRNRTSSPCCGGSTWLSCDAVTKALQKDRLNEARGTGASLLVSDCPRCLIHLRCADEGGARTDGAPLGLAHLVQIAEGTPRLVEPVEHETRAESSASVHPAGEEPRPPVSGKEES